MTTSLHLRVQLHHPGELIAAVPHLLGFHPENSLIAILIDRDGPARLTATFRMDLPGPEHQECCAEHLLGIVRQRRPSAVVLLVVEPATDEPGPPPHADLVANLTNSFTQHGFPVAHALWTGHVARGAPWRCYDESDCGGALPDPNQSELAAATTAEGLVTFASRDELVALLTPDDPATLARRGERLNAAHEVDEPAHPADGTQPTQRDLRLVLDAVDRAYRGRLHLTDDDIVHLALALSNHQVRDACLGTALGDRAAAAEHLWLTLTRSTPEPERAEPAALLAYAAYLRGDGTLAGIAVDRALEANPPHTLAQLLRQALDSGLAPEVLRRIGRAAAIEAGLDPSLDHGAADSP